jgi:carboxyvinyl-carboxyphosphonate phosphorylmutase
MSTARRKMNATERRQQLRALLAGDRCVYAPQVFDPISSRIAEDLGFEVGVGAPPNFELVVTGAPEYGLVTLTEIAEQTRRICRASTIAFIVAGARAIGNALNVMRAVEELESAGASALGIEYQRLPIAFGSPTFRSAMEKRIEVRRDVDYEPAVALEETVGKVKAALAARQDGLVILGRVRVEPDIPEAIRLVKAYEEAGVEGLWLGQIFRRESLEAVHSATKLPLIIGGSAADVAKEHGGERYLVGNGVRIASLGRVPLLASMKAIYDSLKAQRDGKTETELASLIAPRELESRIACEVEYDEWIKKYLY